MTYLRLELSVLYIYKNNVDKLISQLLWYKNMIEVSNALKIEEKRKREEKEKRDLEYKKSSENREKEEEQTKKEISLIIDAIIKKYNLKKEVIWNIKEPLIVWISTNWVRVYKKTKTDIHTKGFPDFSWDVLKELNSILTLGVDKYISTKDLNKWFKQSPKVMNVKKYIDNINSKELIILKKINK